jgi:hypothetical protein
MNVSRRSRSEGAKVRRTMSERTSRRARFVARCWAAFVSMLLVAWPVRTAHAQDEPEKLPQRTTAFTWEKTTLRASFGYRDAMDAAVAQKLASGLPVVLAMRAYLLRVGDNTPVALAGRSCRVVYDLWDEVYRVRVSGGGVERDVATVNVEGVLRQCAEAKDLTLADRKVLSAGKPYFLGVIVEVNPVSAELLAELRRWVTRPAGATGIGPGDVLFGSFVNLFVQKLGAADRVLRFRSQPVIP